jgi:hypothetical protein
LFSSINTAVQDHFRTPEGFFNFSMLSEPRPNTEFFRFGENITGFGRLCHSGSIGKDEASFRDVLADVRFGNDCCLLPFDPTEVATNLRMERYAAMKEHGHLANGFARNGYYLLRPLLPVMIRKFAQRRALRGWEVPSFPHWPVDRSVDQLFERLLVLELKTRNLDSIPFIWFWPEGKSGCVLMTHDVETAAGFRDCGALMTLDDSFGIKASFQLIPRGRYRVPLSVITSMRASGFEVNVHDWNHDGSLFRSYDRFLDGAAEINKRAALWHSEGFRSGALYRNPDWLNELQFAYDMSCPSTARLDPQPGGCCTLLPWFIGSMLEIPVTTIQDYSLFHVLNQYAIDLWRQQVTAILDGHGMASFIVHPDYIRAPRERRVYVQLLEYLAGLRSDSNVWIALPGAVNRWWRERSRMRLVRDGDTWDIQGEGSERARIAYAHVEDDHIVFRVDRPTEPSLIASSGARTSRGDESLA